MITVSFFHIADFDEACLAEIEELKNPTEVSGDSSSELDSEDEVPQGNIKIEGIANAVTSKIPEIMKRPMAKTSENQNEEPFHSFDENLDANENANDISQFLEPTPVALVGGSQSNYDEKSEEPVDSQDITEDDAANLLAEAAETLGEEANGNEDLEHPFAEILLNQQGHQPALQLSEQIQSIDFYDESKMNLLIRLNRTILSKQMAMEKQVAGLVNMMLGQNAGNPQFLNKHKLPVDSVEALKNFNNQLCDEDFKQALVSTA